MYLTFVFLTQTTWSINLIIKIGICFRAISSSDA